MYTIKFDRKYEAFEDNLIGLAVENVLYKNSKLRLSFKEHGLLGDVQRGVFGADCEILEIEGEGGIIYKRFKILESYKAEVSFLGDRQDHLTFNSLKKQLEEIANTPDIEVIKKRFLSEKEEVKTV